MPGVPKRSRNQLRKSRKKNSWLKSQKRKARRKLRRSREPKQRCARCNKPFANLYLSYCGRCTTVKAKILSPESTKSNGQLTVEKKEDK